MEQTVSLALWTVCNIWQTHDRQAMTRTVTQSIKKRSRRRRSSRRRTTTKLKNSYILYTCSSGLFFDSNHHLVLVYFFLSLLNFLHRIIFSRENGEFIFVARDLLTCKVAKNKPSNEWETEAFGWTAFGSKNMVLNTQNGHILGSSPPLRISLFVFSIILHWKSLPNVTIYIKRSKIFWCVSI